MRLFRRVLRTTGGGAGAPDARPPTSLNTSPRWSGAGPEPGERVGCGATQSTSGASSAARESDVGSQPGLCGADLQHLAGRDREGRVHRHRSVTGHRVDGRSRQRDHGLGVKPQPRAAERRLQSRGTILVSRPTVGEHQRRPVRGARTRHTDVRPARPTQVLDRRQRPAARSPRPNSYRLEPHPHPRLEQRRPLTLRIEQHHLGPTQQIPATRRSPRIDPAVPGHPLIPDRRF